MFNFNFLVKYMKTILDDIDEFSKEGLLTFNIEDLTYYLPN